MPTIDDYIRDLTCPDQPVTDGVTCSICHEPFTDPVQLPCEGEHIFCRHCIQEWLEDANTCPLDRNVLVEYDDDDAASNSTPNIHEPEEIDAIPEYLSRVMNEHIIPIALRVAYCQGIHSLTEPDDLSDRLHVALDDLRVIIDPSSFHIRHIEVQIRSLMAVDAAVDEARGLVHTAPSSHRGYQRIREGLADVKIRIAIAREVARNVIESGE